MRNKKRELAHSLALTLLFLAVPAWSAPDPGTWTKIETNHFTIFNQTGDDVGRQVAGNLERLHHTLGILTGGEDPKGPLPTYFYIFRDEVSMAPYRQATSLSSASSGFEGMEVIGGGAPNAGYLVPHEHGNYAVVAGGGGFVPTRYIFKQYIHHRLHEELPDLPNWFRQGVAEYYSAFETEDDFALLGLPSEEHLHWIRYRREPLLPAAELMAMDESDVAVSSQTRQQTFFRQSWLLFHYLLNREGANSQQPAHFIARLAEGVPPQEAFEQAYGLDIGTLNSELETYLGLGSLKYLKIPVKKLDLLIVKFADLKAHEVEYHLGDLMARAVKGGEIPAADHFQNAISMNPAYGPAWAGLGYLAQNAEDHFTARQHYERALSHDPDNFLTAYLYGKSLLRSLAGQRPADEAQEKVLQQAIDALSRSVEQNEIFAEAWADLAYAHGLQTEASDAGVAAQKRALEFFPERSDLALNLLLTHARRAERPEADAILARLEAQSRFPGFDQSALGRAREILLQMDYRDAAQMARQGKSEEAIALFSRIQAQTQNPGLQKTVIEQLEKLSVVGDFQDFFTLYNQAAEAINNGDKATAREIVEALAAKADQKWQKGQIKRLRLGLVQN